MSAGGLARQLEVSILTVFVTIHNIYIFIHQIMVASKKEIQNSKYTIIKAKAKTDNMHYYYYYYRLLRRSSTPIKTQDKKGNKK